MAHHEKTLGWFAPALMCTNLNPHAFVFKPFFSFLYFDFLIDRHFFSTMNIIFTFFYTICSFPNLKVIMFYPDCTGPAIPSDLRTRISELGSPGCTSASKAIWAGCRPCSSCWKTGVIFWKSFEIMNLMTHLLKNNSQKRHNVGNNNNFWDVTFTWSNFFLKKTHSEKDLVRCLRCERSNVSD